MDLIPVSRNFIKPEKDDYERVKRINQILGELSISKEVYKRKLSISDYYDFQIHTRRPPDSCFVNTYFADVSLTWNANMDIQSVFNQYESVASCLSKAQDECSQAMKHAFKMLQKIISKFMKK